MALLGSLVVKIAAETGLFEDALDRAAREAEKRAKAISASLKTIGVSLAAAAGGAGIAIKAALDQADRFDELSQKTGVGVETLSAYSLALRTSGLDSESFAGSMGKLNKAIYDGDDAFKALGVSTLDSSGKVRNTNDIFLDVAQRFSELSDGAAKSALAQKLFGKSGADLIPVLNQGREGLKASADEAKRLGLVLDGSTATLAAAAADQLDKLGLAAQGSANQMLTGLLPALVSIGDEFTKSADSADAWQYAGRVIGTVFREIATAGILVKSIFQVVGDTIGQAAAALVSLATGNFKQANAVLSDTKGLTDILEENAASLGRIWTDAAAAASANSGADSDKLVETGHKALKKIKAIRSEMEKLADARGDVFKDIGDQIAAVRDSADDRLIKTLIASGGSDDQVQKLMGFINDRNRITRESDITQRSEEFASEISGYGKAYEEYSRNFEAINKLFANGVIDAGQYADAISGLDEGFQSFSDVAANIGKGGITEFTRRAASNIQDLTAQLLKGAITGKDFGKSIISSLKSIAAEVAAQVVLKSIFTAAAGSGNGIIASLGSAFLGARANGGPTSANGLYQVNERGPELLTSGGKSFLMMGDSPGNVTPNAALRAYGDGGVRAGGSSVISAPLTLNAQGATSPGEIYARVQGLLAAFERRLGDQASRNDGIFI